MDTQNPHVAILPSPGMDHTIPFLEFGKRLVTLYDFHVSFFVLTTDASAAQTHLLRSTNLPKGLNIIHLPPTDVSGLIPADAAIETLMSIIVRESVPALRSVLADLARPTVLVVDVFGTDTFPLADELNMPKYVFFTSTAMLLALLMYLPTLDVEVTGEYVHLQEPVRIPGCKPIQIENMVDPLLDRKNDRYRWVLHQARRYTMAQGILVNTCEDLEPRTIKALREDPILRKIPTPSVHPVGPIIQSEAPLLSGNECLAWLDRQPDESVIYVSFGSGGTLSAEQITKLAWGLELSRQPFLWLVRPPSGNEKSATYFTSGIVVRCLKSEFFRNWDAGRSFADFVLQVLSQRGCERSFADFVLQVLSQLGCKRSFADFVTQVLSQLGCERSFPDFVLQVLSQLGCERSFADFVTQVLSQLGYEREVAKTIKWGP